MDRDNNQFHSNASHWLAGEFTFHDHPNLNLIPICHGSEEINASPVSGNALRSIPDC